MPIEPMELTVTNDTVPFTIRTDSVLPFVLTGGNASPVSVSLGTPLSGSVDLRGPAGETPKGLQGYCAGRPLANEHVIATNAPYDFIINLNDSVAESLVAATAQVIFTILKENVQIGTITFEAGETVGVIDITDLDILKKDLIVITAPSTEDVTLADITFLLAS